MVSVAAGMALCGLRPITYTIASFMTYRCFEQIRVDVCYHDVPVTIVGVGAGLSYAANAATHHCCEDIAILRALPGMTVVCPGDAAEVVAAVRASADYGRPLYIRLGKKGERAVHAAPPAFEIGKGIVVRDGRDVCLVSTGTMLPFAVDAAARLGDEGISTGVVSMHTVKPLDEILLASMARRCALLVTLEEHSAIGGLGGAIAEWRAAADVATPLLRLGTADAFPHSAGGQSFARRQAGLTPDDIAARIREHQPSRR